MPVRRETADVRACLRQEDLCRFCIHSGNRVHQPLILVKRAEPVSNLGTQPLDALIQIIDMGEQFNDEQSMMRLDTTQQRGF